MTASFLSDHALTRVRERSKFAPEELLALLDRGRYAEIGGGRRRGRMEKLVWSEKDLRYFVVVHNEDGGKVVTLLEFKLHQWRRVYSADLEHARRLALNLPLARPSRSEVKIDRSIAPGTQVFFGACFSRTDAQGLAAQREVELGRFDAGRDSDVARLALREDIKELLREEIASRVQAGDTCLNVWGRVGWRGKRVYLQDMN